MIHKIDKPLARLRKKSKCSNTIRTEREDITTDTTEIQKFQERLLQTIIYHKLDNLEETGKVLESTTHQD